MSEPTTTRCKCFTMQHPDGGYRSSANNEAAHWAAHVAWDRFVEKHEAECPKAQALIPTTDEF